MDSDSPPRPTKRRRKSNKAKHKSGYGGGNEENSNNGANRSFETSTSSSALKTIHATQTVTTRQRACHLLRQHEIDRNCPLFASQLTRDCVSLILNKVSAKDLARVRGSCTFFGDEKGRGRLMIEEEVRRRIQAKGLTTDVMMPEHFWCVSDERVKMNALKSFFPTRTNQNSSF